MFESFLRGSTHAQEDFAIRLKCGSAPVRPCPRTLLVQPRTQAQTFNRQLGTNGLGAAIAAIAPPEGSLRQRYLCTLVIQVRMSLNR
jgi:hypothetical protein